MERGATRRRRSRGHENTSGPVPATIRLCLAFADDAYNPSGGRVGTAIAQWYRAKAAGYGHQVTATRQLAHRSSGGLAIQRGTLRCTPVEVRC